MSEDNIIVSSGDYKRPDKYDFKLDRYYDEINIIGYNKYGGMGPFSRFVENRLGSQQPYSALLSKRGCRAHCSFCTVRSFNGKGLRLREINGVLDEIQYLYNKGIRYIEWLDDDLLYDEKYMLELFSEMKSRFPELVWTASNGLIGTAITEPLMKEMAESGLVAFKIGVESGNSEVIKNIRKPTTLWRLLDKAELIRCYPDIFFSANFIVGFPEETFGQMYDSFTFARKLECDWSSFYVCQPLKGTDLFSSFQHLMDPRTNDETYTKTINPGRSAARGEFSYSEKGKITKGIKAGWQIFDLELSRTFSAEEHNEIWFTFNLVANFLDNPCYKSAVLTKKLICWLESISSAYPYDASMCAALAHSYKLIGEEEKKEEFKKRTIEIIRDSKYWRSRFEAFPELLLLADITSLEGLKLEGLQDVPQMLIPQKYVDKFSRRLETRDMNGWKD